MPFHLLFRNLTGHWLRSLLTYLCCWSPSP